jgi:hypothetical protein
MKMVHFTTGNSVTDFSIHSKRGPFNLPSPCPLGSKRNINAPKTRQLALKQESFPDEKKL